MSTTSPALRQIGSVVLIFLGAVALVVGILSRYADRNLLDPERFAERAVKVLDDQGARDEIADVIVNELERFGLERSQTQKPVQKNVDEIAENEQFREALVAGLVIANEAALGDDKEGVSVKVEDVGATLEDTLRAVDPRLAKQIPQDIDLVVAETGSAKTLVNVARKAESFGSLAIPLAILGLLLMAGGVFVANDRRTAVFGAAMGIALSGVAVFAGYIGGREIAARQPDDEAAQDAARAIWDAVFGGLETLGLTMAAAGAMVALIAGVITKVRVPGRE